MTEINIKRVGDDSYRIRMQGQAFNLDIIMDEAEMWILGNTIMMVFEARGQYRERGRRRGRFNER